MTRRRDGAPRRSLTGEPRDGMDAGPAAWALDFDSVTLSWPLDELGARPHGTLRRAYQGLREVLSAFDAGGFSCNGYSVDPSRGLGVIHMTADPGCGHELVAALRPLLRQDRLPRGGELALTPANERRTVIVPVGSESEN